MNHTPPPLSLTRTNSNPLLIFLKERFGELLGVTATDNNFKILRERIAQSPPPKLPYLGTFLADLTFIEEGNPDYLDDAKIIINFAKRQLLSARISDVQIYQQQKYNLMVQWPSHGLNKSD